MKCTNCGKKLKNNEKFCTYCGYYNSNENDTNWSNKEEHEDLLDENWYDDELDSKEEDEGVELVPLKKEKKKKEKKIKEEKVKIEKLSEESPKEDKKEKKEKEVKEIKLKEDNTVYDENEKYIESYIGEDYKIIKKSPFNIWAFLLNWMYFLYRKLYITGIIGLIITALVAFFLTKYFLIYLVITLIVLGFGFNPYYIFIIKGRVKKILVDYEGSDTFSLQKICGELGGVNVVLALIIYLIFLVVIVLSIVKPTFNTSHNTKFWKENSENKANCNSLVKLTYQEEKSNFDRIEEALCKVNKNTNKYDLYLKAIKKDKIIYVYYETENDYIVYQKNTELLEILDKKNKEKTITVEEAKYLSDIKMIISNYSKIHKKSIEEDKLIQTKRNKEEKLNYIFEYEEIIR